ncbi:MAG TPA: excinuclease ABC subunit UvrB [Candidatus Paceibacterota bacterium]|jgi:excinuclease ABC, B subunit
MASLFKINNEFKPAGDQPKAIQALVEGVKKGMRHQTLLGVTGSGKTFTCANVIAQIGKPTLVIAHNKTLAAQLAQEYREFFPNNAVHYFVSYYDYYQPEAYMPHTDTYIEKEAMINAEIEKLRHASTQALLTRKDVIIVASVSCIYGLGSPKEYEKVNMRIEKGMKADRAEMIRRMIGIHFERTNADLEPGQLRAVGNMIEVMPVNEETIYRISFEDERISAIDQIDPVTRALRKSIDVFFLFPAKHFITDKGQVERAFQTIKAELDAQLKQFDKGGKILEAERLKRRTTYDLAMIREIGYCNGIENYSRHFSGKLPGEPPDTLLSYFPHKPDGTADFLTVIDESHVTVPQIGGMYAGDQSRKETLVEHGFRLPSAKDNRPLQFVEFEKSIGQAIYTSATPAEYERKNSSQIVEQLIRPTGLLDPVIDIRPVVEKGEFRGQIADSIVEAEKTIKAGFRVILTTLTKKMAEDLVDFLKERKIRAEYLHSDIKTIERIEILTNFRKGDFDVLVGVNLLREGLDLPEVALIGILDADKEGFLRSETSLIQIIGRAARNAEGRVIIYADQVTGSIDRAVKETRRRRLLQEAYNKEHGITPKTIVKAIKSIADQLQSEHQKAVAEELRVDEAEFKKNPKAVIKKKEAEMNEAVKALDFETAAILRDEIQVLYDKLDGIAPATATKKKKKRKD